MRQVLFTTRAATLLGETIVLIMTLVKIHAGPFTIQGLLRRYSLAEVLLTDGMSVSL